MKDNGWVVALVGVLLAVLIMSGRPPTHIDPPSHDDPLPLIDTPEQARQYELALAMAREYYGEHVTLIRNFGRSPCAIVYVHPGQNGNPLDLIEECVGVGCSWPEAFESAKRRGRPKGWRPVSD